MPANIEGMVKQYSKFAFLKTRQQFNFKGPSSARDITITFANVDFVPKIAFVRFENSSNSENFVWDSRRGDSIYGKNTVAITNPRFANSNLICRFWTTASQDFFVTEITLIG